MKYLVALLVISTTFIGSSASSAELTGDQIRQTISGKSAKWSSGKFGGSINWQSNGTQSVTGNFSAFTKDTGAWRIKGNKLCSKWKKIRNGAETCDAWDSKGGKKYQAGNSSITMN